MEREAFFSGYCRQIDGSRTVCVEAQDQELTQTDCLMDACPYSTQCSIHEKIEDFLKEA